MITWKHMQWSTCVVSTSSQPVLHKQHIIWKENADYKLLFINLLLQIKNAIAKKTQTLFHYYRVKYDAKQQLTNTLCDQITSKLAVS